jgi:flagellin-like hook-associated protein FlgL
MGQFVPFLKTKRITVLLSAGPERSGTRSKWRLARGIESRQSQLQRALCSCGHRQFAISYVVDNNAGRWSANLVEIETGQSIAVNQPGSQLFSAAGANVFQSLNDLVTALQDPTSTADDIGAATTETRNAYDQLTSARAFYGSTIDRVLSSQGFINSESVQLSQQQNRTVGVDMNVAVTNLANGEEAQCRGASRRHHQQSRSDGLSVGKRPLKGRANAAARGTARMLGCTRHDC